MTEVPLFKLFCQILKNLLACTWSALILYGKISTKENVAGFLWWYHVHQHSERSE